MEPQVQYTRTKDGVNIAYSKVGEGPPLVIMPMMPMLSMQMTWELPEFSGSDAIIGRGRTRIRYDSRGFGLSDREPQEFTLDTLGIDLEAVTDRIGLDRFDLMGVFNAGPAAIAYAARNPDRVDRLILYTTFASGASLASKPTFGAFLAMREVDWESYVSVMSRQLSSDSRAASMLHDSASPANYQAFIEALPGMDASGYLADVSSETLVVAAREVTMAMILDDARTLAAGIAGARFVVVDTIGAGFPAVADFLGVDSDLPTPHPGADVRSGTAIILFADIVDSTVLTEKLGDDAFREKARELDTALRNIIRENGGTPIEGKLLGDGVLATFSSASQAIAAALACGKAGEDGGLPLHLGLHAGDVIREDNNVFGGAVNVAARISGLSAAGEVLVSDTVRSLARTSAGVSFEDRGEQELKGVGEAVRVWAVSPS